MSQEIFKVNKPEVHISNQNFENEMKLWSNTYPEEDYYKKLSVVLSLKRRLQILDDNIKSFEREIRDRNYRKK